MRAASSSLAILLALGLCGCRTVQRPLDNTPLPVFEPVETRGGGTIVKDARGRLILRPRPDDFVEAWGVVLEDSEVGVLVTARLSSRSLLEEGDVLRFIKTVGFVESEGSAALLRRGRSGVTVEELSAGGQGIRSLKDLGGYGLVWCFVDLVVVRSGVESIVRQEVGRPRRLPLHPWESEKTQALGFALTRIDDWPEDWRPRRALPGDLLVTHVGEESLLALRGLRPLDLVRLTQRDFELMKARRAQGNPAGLPSLPKSWGEVALDPESLDGVDFEGVLNLQQLRVLKAGSGEKVVRMPESMAYEQIDLPLLPGVFSYENNQVRSRWQVGPAGLVADSSDRMVYNRATDSYRLQRDTRLLNSFIYSTTGGDGLSDDSRYGVDLPFFHFRSRRSDVSRPEQD